MSTQTESMTSRTESTDVRTLTASAAEYRRYRQAILDGTARRPRDPSLVYDGNGVVRGPWSRH